jgi:hypothetical protein
MLVVAAPVVVLNAAHLAAAHIVGEGNFAMVS